MKRVTGGQPVDSHGVGLLSTLCRGYNKIQISMSCWPERKRWGCSSFILSLAKAHKHAHTCTQANSREYKAFSNALPDYKSGCKCVCGPVCDACSCDIFTIGKNSKTMMAPTATTKPTTQGSRMRAGREKSYKDW